MNNEQAEGNCLEDFLDPDCRMETRVPCLIRSRNRPGCASYRRQAKPGRGGPLRSRPLTPTRRGRPNEPFGLEPRHD
jgi:hypothetical protein